MTAQATIEQAAFPLKIKTRKEIIDTLSATASESVLKVLSRFTSQIIIQDETERDMLLEHITSNHGKGSTNGIEKKHLRATAKVISELKQNLKEDEVMSEDTIAWAVEEAGLDEERVRQITTATATKKQGTKAERKTADTIMAKAEAIAEGTLTAIKNATKTPVPSEVKFAAEQALNRGSITEELRTMVCSGEMTLDKAKAITIAMPPEEKPKGKRTASANPTKRSTTNPAKGKDKPTRVVPTWEIALLDESGEVKEVLYEAITAKDLLALKGIEKDTGKVSKLLATDHGLPVRMTNSNSGSFYIKKPSKQVATK